ncbi:hypothetical protein Sp245p_17185 (plasmid) [Azospirillum baldaniorum]|nr:hypothetical protein Sp245p_17185 [Azospirillum baldaniorum]
MPDVSPCISPSPALRATLSPEGRGLVIQGDKTSSPLAIRAGLVQLVRRRSRFTDSPRPCPP